MNAISNLSVKIKIIIMISIVMVLSLVSITISTTSMNSIGNQMENIVEHDMPLSRVITNITIHQLEQAINFERAMRYGVSMSSNFNDRKNFKHAVEKFVSLSAKVNQELIQGKQLVEQAMAAAYDARSIEELENVTAMMTRIDREHHEYDAIGIDVLKKLSEGKLDAVRNISTQIEVLQENLDHELEALLLELASFTHDAAEVASNHEHTAIKMIVIVSVIYVVVGAVMSFFIIASIGRRLNGAVKAANRVADGDLTMQYGTQSKDEIGVLMTAMEKMQNKLSSLIGVIHDSAARVASAAEQLSAASEETNESINAQRQEVEQVATAMNEMTATVKEVARNASDASVSANEAKTVATEGDGVVKQAVKSINLLSEEIQSTSGVVKNVHDESENITLVLDVIKGIAEQTNLLALNAAIEAARAGEQGRGFAVVADEVRTLAYRTQQSTEEIENMIGRLQQGAAQAVQVMDNSQVQTKLSNDKASEAGQALTVITSSIDTITEMNIQIAAASEEQSAVAEEINRNVNNVSGFSQEVSDAAAQISSASAELAEMASQLVVEVQTFSV